MLNYLRLDDHYRSSDLGEPESKWYLPQRTNHHVGLLKVTKQPLVSDWGVCKCMQILWSSPSLYLLVTTGEFFLCLFTE